MARLRASCLFAVAMACAPGCGRTPCEELVPAPIVGSYTGSGTLGDERLLKVSLEASERQVVLSYTTKDGSRIRALYRVLDRGK
jgi:hypothetical protein